MNKMMHNTDRLHRHSQVAVLFVLKAWLNTGSSRREMSALEATRYVVTAASTASGTRTVSDAFWRDFLRQYESPASFSHGVTAYLAESPYFDQDVRGLFAAASMTMTDVQAVDLAIESLKTQALAAITR